MIPSLPLLRKTEAHSAVMTVRSTKTVAVLASVDALRVSKPIEERVQLADKADTGEAFSVAGR